MSEKALYPLCLYVDNVFFSFFINKFIETHAGDSNELDVENTLLEILSDIQTPQLHQQVQIISLSDFYFLKRKRLENM